MRSVVSELLEENKQQEKPLKSPCVSVCALDEDDVCVGCYRTGNEISHWGGMNNDERREVLARSVERAKNNNPFA